MKPPKTPAELTANAEALMREFTAVLEDYEADDKTMILASIYLLTGIVGSMYGDEVGVEMYGTVTKLLMTKKEIPLDDAPDPEEAKFWNLMAEGYDPPARFGLKKKAKAAKRGAK